MAISRRGRVVFSFPGPFLGYAPHPERILKCPSGPITWTFGSRQRLDYVVGLFVHDATKSGLSLPRHVELFAPSTIAPRVRPRHTA